MAELFGLTLIFALGALLLPVIAAFMFIKLVLKTIFLPFTIVIGFVKLILTVVLVPVAIIFGITMVAVLTIFAIPFLIAAAVVVGAAHLIL